MTNEKRQLAKRKRLMFRSVVLSSWAFLAGGLLGGCPATPPPVEPTPPTLTEEPLPKECLVVQKARDILTPLGLQAMARYGRIDPSLYRPTTDSEVVEVDGNIRTLANTDSKEFDTALAALNQAEDVQRLFKRRLEAARAKCRDGLCPTNPIAISVTAEDPNSDLPEELRSKGVELFGKFARFRVIEGESPTPEQWEAAFFSIYNVTVPQCPLAGAFALDDKGKGAKLDGSARTALGVMLQSGTGSSGTAHWLTDCGGSSECQNCGHSGDYHWTKSGLYCCGSLCP